MKKPELATVTVALLPVAFNIPIGGSLANFSLADPVMPFLLFQVLLGRKYSESRRLLRGLLYFLFSIAISLLVVVSSRMLILSASGEDLSQAAFFSDLFKFLVCLGYLFSLLIYCYDAFLQQDYSVFVAWRLVSVLVATLGILGSWAAFRGIATPFASYYRATSTFEDPNTFASFLLFSLGVSLFCSKVSNRRLFTWHLVPLVAAIYFSFSRAALIALIIFCVFALVIIFTVRGYIFEKFLVVILSIGIIIVLYNARLSTALSIRDGDITSDIRFVLWRHAVDIWLENVVLGRGLGQFRMVSSVSLSDSDSLLAHNTYLSFLSETGLLGIVILSMIPLVVFVFWIQSRDLGSTLLVSGLASIAVMAVSLNLQNARYLWAGIAFSLAYSLFCKNRAEDPAKLASGPFS